MARAATVFAALLVAGSSTAAGADTLKPLQAGTFTLEAWTASVYYTASSADYEVVRTIASPHQSEPVPIRFVAALAPGEKQSIAVGSFGTSALPAVLEIARTGDVVSARVVQPTTTGW